MAEPRSEGPEIPARMDGREARCLVSWVRFVLAKCAPRAQKLPIDGGCVWHLGIPSILLQRPTTYAVTVTRTPDLGRTGLGHGR